MSYYDDADEGTLPDGRVVLCGANAYQEKYFLNQDFEMLPEDIKEELRIISVLFTQEAGGVFMIVFDEEGTPEFETMVEEDDITYDDISAGLLINKIRMNRRELLEQLCLFYRVWFLGEKLED